MWCCAPANNNNSNNNYAINANFRKSGLGRRNPNPTTHILKDLTSDKESSIDFTSSNLFKVSLRSDTMSHNQGQGGPRRQRSASHELKKGQEITPVEPYPAQALTPEEPIVSSRRSRNGPEWASKPKTEDNSFLSNTPPFQNPNEIKFSEMQRNQEEHLAYRDLMLARLQAVRMSEDEFERYIRMQRETLFGTLSEERVRALMVVINKEDFKNNFDLSEEEYEMFNQRFGLDLAKNRILMGVISGESREDSSPDFGSNVSPEEQKSSNLGVDGRGNGILGPNKNLKNLEILGKADNLSAFDGVSEIPVVSDDRDVSDSHQNLIQTPSQPSDIFRENSFKKSENNTPNSYKQAPGAEENAQNQVKRPKNQDFGKISRSLIGQPNLGIAPKKAKKDNSKTPPIMIANSMVINNKKKVEKPKNLKRLMTQSSKAQNCAEVDPDEPVEDRAARSSVRRRVNSQQLERNEARVAGEKKDIQIMLDLKGEPRISVASKRRDLVKALDQKLENKKNSGLTTNQYFGKDQKGGMEAGEGRMAGTKGPKPPVYPGKQLGGRGRSVASNQPLNPSLAGPVKSKAGMAQSQGRFGGVPPRGGGGYHKKTQSQQNFTYGQRGEVDFTKGSKKENLLFKEALKAQTDRSFATGNVAGVGEPLNMRDQVKAHKDGQQEFRGESGPRNGRHQRALSEGVQQPFIFDHQFGQTRGVVQGSNNGLRPRPRVKRLQGGSKEGLKQALLGPGAIFNSSQNYKTEIAESQKRVQSPSPGVLSGLQRQQLQQQSTKAAIIPRIPINQMSQKSQASPTKSNQNQPFSQSGAPFSQKITRNSAMVKSTVSRGLMVASGSRTERGDSQQRQMLSVHGSGSRRTSRSPTPSQKLKNIQKFSFKPSYRLPFSTTIGTAATKTLTGSSMIMNHPMTTRVRARSTSTSKVLTTRANPLRYQPTAQIHQKGQNLLIASDFARFSPTATTVVRNARPATVIATTTTPIPATTQILTERLRTSNMRTEVLPTPEPRTSSRRVPRVSRSPIHQVRAIKHSPSKENSANRVNIRSSVVSKFVNQSLVTTASKKPIGGIGARYSRVSSNAASKGVRTARKLVRSGKLTKMSASNINLEYGFQGAIGANNENLSKNRVISSASRFSSELNSSLVSGREPSNTQNLHQKIISGMRKNEGFSRQTEPSGLGVGVRRSSRASVVVYNSSQAQPRATELQANNSQILKKIAPQSELVPRGVILSSPLDSPKRNPTNYNATMPLQPLVSFRAPPTPAVKNSPRKANQGAGGMDLAPINYATTFVTRRDGSINKIVIDGTRTPRSTSPYRRAQNQAINGVEGGQKAEIRRASRHINIMNLPVGAEGYGAGARSRSPAQGNGDLSTSGYSTAWVFPSALKTMR